METRTVTIITKEGQFDKGAEMPPAELYRPVSREPFGIDTLDELRPEHLEFYRTNGYLVVRRAFSPPEVAAALAGLVDLIMGKRPDFRGIWFEAQAKEILPQLHPEQRQDAVRKIGRFVGYDERLRALAFHPRLFAALRALLGDEPHMFQDMGLIKPPRLGREKPWHQDQAYFNYPLGTRIVGAWIALDEATLENGCMQVLPGWHRQGPIVHFMKRDWQICDREILGHESLAVPLAPGGLLFFDGLLPHGTPHNASSRRRRAVQFHYAPRSAREVPEEERLRVFGSEGKAVTC